ncbi:CHASE2 domain-containing protein [Xanthomonas sp. 1678]|uniref:CHASE2 domain-containing protein n=1 Tax=Xanthomonas sp. 1678 TaxID=3158788 RepID=UPI002861E69B|nr:diguanylate cyclase (GGDEF)-like protein [Xanthomonas translucens]MEB1528878.1 CHASE2 domain-containing protein [Xanthomonas campestris pv. campestris]
MKAPTPLRWLAAAAAAALAAGFGLSDGLWRLDNTLYDTLVTHWRYTPDSSVVLVMVDDRSLQALGQWPWPRSTHARLLDRLSEAGVKRVALDLVLSEPDQADPDNDARLAAALRRNGNTVLPVTTSSTDAGEMPQELLPVPAIARAAAGLAHTDIEIDADGVSRGIYLRAGLGNAHWPALGVALAGLAPPWPGLASDAGPAADAMPYRWHRDDYVGVRYAGPPGSFPQLSYVDVLEGRVPAQALRGRRVIVGVGATGLGQRFLTPMSHESWMNGAEYQANVAAMLLGGHAITPLSKNQQIGTSALLALLAVLGMTYSVRHRRWPWLALPVMLALIVAGSLLCALASGRWFAPTACLAAVTLVSAGWLGLRIAHWQRQAHRDGLTGLANRHSFELAFRQELAMAQRSGKPLTLIVVDIDHFKRYNDALGHHSGDRALTLVAAAVARHARRAHDVAARFGGDEFAMILPDTALDDARQIAEALLEDIRQLTVPGPQGPVPITVTLGVHSTTVDAETRNRDFFAQADAALYRAKTAGRDGYACSTPGQSLGKR